MTSKKSLPQRIWGPSGVPRSATHWSQVVSVHHWLRSHRPGLARPRRLCFQSPPSVSHLQAGGEKHQVRPSAVVKHSRGHHREMG